MFRPDRDIGPKITAQITHRVHDADTGGGCGAG